MTIRVLERTTYRAPLAVICQDGVTEAVVSGDLTATAWLRDDPARAYPAPAVAGVRHARLGSPGRR